MSFIWGGKRPRVMMQEPFQRMLPMSSQGLIEQLAPPPAGEVCAACGRVIGQLEQPYVWDENIVCFGCHRGLSTAGESAGSPATGAAPERVIFSDANAVVTQAQVTISGVAYPLADIRFARMGRSASRRPY